MLRRMLSKTLITYFAVFCFLSGCVYDVFDNKLIIVNKSNQTIFVNLSKTNSFSSFPVLIDTLKGDTLWEYMSWIPAGDSLRNQPPFGGWEDYINKRCEDSTLTVFIFDRKLLKNNSRDTLVKNQLYSKKYSYTVKHLQKLHWRIEQKY